MNNEKTLDNSKEVRDLGQPRRKAPQLFGELRKTDPMDPFTRGLAKKKEVEKQTADLQKSIDETKQIEADNKAEVTTLIDDGDISTLDAAKNYTDSKVLTSLKYIHLNVNADVINVDNGTILPFTSVIDNNGFTISNNGIDLKAGVTYLIEAFVNTRSSSSVYLGYNLETITGQWLANAYTATPNATGYGFKAPIRKFFTPVTDTTVRIKISDDALNSGHVTSAYGTFFTALEIKGAKGEKGDPGPVGGLDGPTPYVHLGMSAAQSVDVGTIVNFDTVRSSNGMTVNGNGVRLLAGKTYRLQAYVNIGSNSTGNQYLGCNFYDNNTQISQQFYTNTPAAVNHGMKAPGFMYYKPVADTTVYVKVTDDNIGTGTIENGWNTSFIVEQVVGMKGDQGDIGPVGPPNVLSIGTVTSDVVPFATITGTSPAQVLNLVLPKGDQGIQGIQGIQGKEGMVWKGAWSSGTTYMIDDVVLYGGSSYICIQDTNLNHQPGGTGWTSWWQYVACAGTNGTSWYTSSTQSIVMQMGSVAINTGVSGLGWTPGQRCRIVYITDPTQYMEGVVTAYSGATLTVTIDRVKGSGTYNSWRISPTGDVGDRGDKGDSGLGLTPIPNEAVSGVKNGSNKTFTLANSPDGAINLFLNGGLLKLTTEYTISGQTITMVTAPNSDDDLNASYFTNSILGLPGTVENLTMLQIMSKLYPVGTVYTNESDSRNPNVIFGFGTWVAIQGEVVVGYKSGDTNFGTPGASVGEATHLLTGAESGEKGHNHTQNAHNHANGNFQYLLQYTASSTIATTDNTGTEPNLITMGAIQSATATNNAVTASDATQAHNNVQPSHVCYVWKRTA